MVDPYRLISKKLLTDADCAQLITKHDNNLEKLVQQHNRSVNIKEIDIHSIPNLYSSLIAANTQLYQFDLNGINECYFAKYLQDDHYNTLHLDVGPGEITRKLSFTLFLNEEFSGGDFYMLEERIDKKKGKLLVFPSFLPHKITSVIQGTRYAIFGFLSGPRLK